MTERSEVSEFTKGQLVRVIDGPLVGEEAVCVEFRPLSRWVVSIQVSGRAVAVELECDHLAKIDSADVVELGCEVRRPGAQHDSA